ncbi:hypothetical protein HMN09_00315700 [Mycena chlorophos]|uniref:Uncharacterized protein n=1 Tax=Mycena chlorophos TaxID=658473 RepID=A0A8H6WKH8_MYCCL|nr:hypothetical protein HMN09_00315700 [Mycena chlorophos]
MPPLRQRARNPSPEPRPTAPGLLRRETWSGRPFAEILTKIDARALLQQRMAEQDARSLRVDPEVEVLAGQRLPEDESDDELLLVPPISPTVLEYALVPFPRSPTVSPRPNPRFAGCAQRRRRRPRRGWPSARTSRRSGSGNNPMPGVPYRVPKAVGAKHVEAAKKHVIRVETNAAQLPHLKPAWIGDRDAAGPDPAVVAALNAFDWDADDVNGRLGELGLRYVRPQNEDPVPVLDVERRLIVLVAGCPRGADWTAKVAAANTAVESLAPQVALPPEKLAHHRAADKFPALARGILHGGGQVAPGKLVVTSGNKKVTDALLANDGFKAIVGFTSYIFSTWLPLVFLAFQATNLALAEWPLIFAFCLQAASSLPVASESASNVSSGLQPATAATVRPSPTRPLCKPIIIRPSHWNTTNLSARDARHDANEHRYWYLVSGYAIYTRRSDVDELGPVVSSSASIESEPSTEDSWVDHLSPDELATYLDSWGIEDSEEDIRLQNEAQAADYTADVERIKAAHQREAARLNRDLTMEEELAVERRVMQAVGRRLVDAAAWATVPHGVAASSTLFQRTSRASSPAGSQTHTALSADSMPFFRLPARSPNEHDLSTSPTANEQAPVTAPKSKHGYSAAPSSARLRATNVDPNGQSSFPEEPSNYDDNGEAHGLPPTPPPEDDDEDAHGLPPPLPSDDDDDDEPPASRTLSQLGANSDVEESSDDDLLKSPLRSPPRRCKPVIHSDTEDEEDWGITPVDPGPHNEQQRRNRMKLLSADIIAGRTKFAKKEQKLVHSLAKKHDLDVATVERKRGDSKQWKKTRTTSMRSALTGYYCRSVNERRVAAGKPKIHYTVAQARVAKNKSLIDFPEHIKKKVYAEYEAKQKLKATGAHATALGESKDAEVSSTKLTTDMINLGKRTKTVLFGIMAPMDGSNSLVAPAVLDAGGARYMFERHNLTESEFIDDYMAWLKLTRKSISKMTIKELRKYFMDFYTHGARAAAGVPVAANYANYLSAIFDSHHIHQSPSLFKSLPPLRRLAQCIQDKTLLWKLVPLESEQEQIAKEYMELVKKGLRPKPSTSRRTRSDKNTKAGPPEEEMCR